MHVRLLQAHIFVHRTMASVVRTPTAFVVGAHARAVPALRQVRPYLSCGIQDRTSLRSRGSLAATSRRDSGRRYVLQTPVPTAETEPASDDAPRFDWWSRWWAVAPAATVDWSKPFATDLLGMKLVLWRDPEGGTLRCFLDECPHRLAPLSEGRVESSGQLYCAYHGWSFNADGSAAEIPSLRGSPEAMEKACGQPRASCTTFPVREAHGYVYVYAKPGPEAFVEAYAKELPFLPPWVSEDQVAAVMDLVQVYARDLPYSFDTLVENLADPDHVPFAHHTIQGNRNKYRPPASRRLETFGEDCQMLVSELGPQTADGKGRTRAKVQTLWQAPGHIMYEFISEKDVDKEDKERGFTGIVILMTPLRPGWSRLHFRVASTKLQKASPIAKAVLGAKAALPKWLDHFERALVLNSDSIILNRQEAAHIRKAGVDLTAYLEGFAARNYMPTKSDLLVKAFRSWFASAGGLPFDLRDTLHALDAVDRYAAMNGPATHHHLCKSCAGALRQMRFATQAAQVAFSVCVAALLARAASLVGAAGAGAASAASAASGAAGSSWFVSAVAAAAGAVVGSPATMGLLAGAVVAAVVWRVAGQLAKRLEFEDFVHQERYTE